MGAEGIEHDLACRNQLMAVELYDEKYPDYCRSCNGAGYHHDPGVWMYADGSGEPPSDEPCVCVEAGRCPRCGVETAIMEVADWGAYAVCIECGFDERKLFRVEGFEGEDYARPDDTCECGED